MRVRDTPRDSDELVLSWIAQRSGGIGPSAIARAHGLPSQRVSVATARVLEADLAQSGEDPEQVRRAYW
ncbi:hypothetical protein DDZ14_08425 [Maritimibacter sp. 55A14]|uniref:hypothetical protein n=1 Tax=Maritimibacter sp. 55A14 TaxID=2174844 RepID=UPI000D6135E9|nr:hypothetical protein [Maritimibacter sp. 55A14]PWE32762.1 hypothetical protein DDZ14_08425 [Maritimibacter sp. 55A14]